MQCNLCNKNPATVHLTEIIDDQMSELHLCDDCARKKSMQMEQQFGLSDLLGGLVEYGKQISGSEKTPVAAQCSFCGLTYEDFRKIGRLGCSECYGSFARHLGPLLKRIHGACQHVGKAPVLISEPTSAADPAAPVASKPSKAKSSLDLNDLKMKLSEAILKEEFEEAAQLRDLIKEMEKKKKGSLKKDVAE
jgi:protein arginine kinase activator